MPHLDRRDGHAYRAGAPQELAGDGFCQSLGGLCLGRLVLGRLGWIERRTAIVPDARLPALGIALDIPPASAFTAVAGRNTRLVLSEAWLFGESPRAIEGVHHPLAGHMASERAAVLDRDRAVTRFGFGNVIRRWVSAADAETKRRCDAGDKFADA